MDAVTQLLPRASTGVAGLDDILGGGLAAKRPTLPVLFVTGFADRTALAGISEAQIISKPFIDDELVHKVRLALAEDDSRKVIRLRR
jgi:FixJ family two-component response regulator